MSRELFPISIAWDQYPVNCSALSLRELCSDADLAYNAIRETKEYFGLDSTGEYTYIPEGTCLDLGGTLIYPENGICYAADYPLKTPEDIERLEIPDIENCPTVGYATRILERMTEDGLTPGIYIFSIMGRAAQLTGYQALLILMRKDPYHFGMLMDKMHDFTMNEIEYYAKKFPSNDFWVSTAYSLEGQDLMSPGDFMKYCAPRIDFLHRELLNRGFSNISVCLCGNHTRNLDYWNEIGIPDGSSFWMDPCMDDEMCVSRMSDRFHVGWGLDSECLRYCTPEEVYRTAVDIIRKHGRRRGGFTLMADCVLPYDTPKENVKAFINAAEDCAAFAEKE